MKFIAIVAAFAVLTVPALAVKKHETLIEKIEKTLLRANAATLTL